jgi:hypothetical protein
MEARTLILTSFPENFSFLSFFTSIWLLKMHVNVPKREIDPPLEANSVLLEETTRSRHLGIRHPYKMRRA